MTNLVPLSTVAGSTGLVTDGDWILSENMSADGAVRLLQLADIGAGQFLDRSSRYISTATFHELGCTALQPGDVLISRMADPIGRACLVPDLCQPSVTAVDVTIVRTDPDIADPRYLVYVCNSPGFLQAAAAAATGTTRSRITRRNLEKILIPVPPVSEQRRIVEILDEADRLRKLRAEADANAERILPALFIKMFGDPTTWNENPRSVPLATTVRPLSGGTPSKAEPRFWQGTIPWVSPKDMKRPFISDSEDHISQDAGDALGIVPAEAVLIVVRGMILARSVPVALTKSDVTINQDMKALLVTDTRVSASYIWALLCVAESEMLRRVGTAGHGTRKLDTEQLLSLPVIVPNAEERVRVESVVSWYQQSHNAREESARNLDRIFKSLVARSFQGRITDRETATGRELRMAR